MPAVVSQDSPGRADADLQAVVAAVNDPQPVVIALVVAVLLVAVVLNGFNLYWLMVLDPFLARRHLPREDARHDEGAEESPSSPERRPARASRPVGLDPLRALAPPPEPPPRRHDRQG